MYREYLEKQIKALEALQNEQNAVEFSRQILFIAKELDEINSKSDEVINTSKWLESFLRRQLNK